MDLQRKTIQSMTATLDGKREELAVFYRQFGEKLLKDSSDPVILAGAIVPERLDSWKSLMTSRQSDNSTILDIKAAVSRQQELLSFRKELDRTLAGEKSRQHEQFEKLGRVFFREYSADRDEACFGTAWHDASRENNALAELEDKRDTLRLELSEAGFFGKMFAQFRMAGLASNIRLRRTRIQKILADGASRLVQSGELEKRMDAGTYEPELSTIYSSIRESALRLDELKNRAESLETDLESVADTLSVCGATGIPSRRLEELRTHIHETDKRIDALTALCAREYSDKFLDENGVSILGDTGDGNTFSDMGVYAHQLEQIALYRSDITVIRRRIEILETSLRIETIDRNIASYERSIADYEHKIGHYRQLSENLRKNIEDAGAERARLIASRDEMSQTTES